MEDDGRTEIRVILGLNGEWTAYPVNFPPRRQYATGHGRNARAAAADFCRSHALDEHTLEFIGLRRGQGLHYLAEAG